MERSSLTKIWDVQYEGMVGVEEHAGILSSLRELKLFDLPNLMYLWEESTHPCKAYKNLYTLEVGRCGRLKNLVPSSVSFQNLVNLMVTECHGMECLLTSSTAKSMTKLKIMSISGCQQMKRITSNGEEGDTEGEIGFNQLKVLKLNWLPFLTSFYSGNCLMRFPNLEKMVVRKCPQMQTFSAGVVSTPMLHILLIDMEDENSSESDAESENEHAESSFHQVENSRPINDINDIISQHWSSALDTLLQYDEMEISEQSRGASDMALRYAEMV